MGQDDALVDAEKQAELDANGGNLAKKTGRWRPPALGWDHYRADLADIKDLLQVVVATTGQAERAPEPLPRPETATDRWEKKWRKANTEHLNARLGITL